MLFKREWKTFGDALVKVSSTEGKDDLKMVVIFASVGREEVPDHIVFWPRVREVGCIRFEFQQWWVLQHVEGASCDWKSSWETLGLSLIFSLTIRKHSRWYRPEKRDGLTMSVHVVVMDVDPARRAVYGYNKTKPWQYHPRWFTTL